MKLLILTQKRFSMSEFEYVSLDELLKRKKYPFSKGQMRAFLMHRNENGLYAAIRKIGKKLYFRVDLFDKWIESHGEV